MGISSKVMEVQTGYQFTVDNEALKEFMMWWQDPANRCIVTPVPELIREIYACGVALLHG